MDRLGVGAGNRPAAGPAPATETPRPQQQPGDQYLAYCLVQACKLLLALIAKRWPNVR